MSSATPPRVFVSYSHDSDEHRSRVVALAQRLRGDGIDAWIDVFEPAPPQGWPGWMRAQVQGADFVVLVCTASYRRRFEGREEPGVGRGVTYEGLLATQLLYEGSLDFERVVPVVFEDAGEDDIPVDVRPATCHRLGGEYESLRKRLTRQLAITPATLGEGVANYEGLPDALSPTDQLSLLQDQLEQRAAANEDASDVREEILELRRRIRNGPNFATGDILAGRYRLHDVAGTGGFATVWRAYDRRKQHLVAVKILHGQWANDASRVGRFESGARRMDSLRHEAIVAMLGDPIQDEHHHFCVMQWFAGGDLDRAVRQGTIDRPTALAAVAQVAMGLAHAHAHEVIHRDVKPANILLDEQGRGCITDFDLARAKDSTHGTRTGGLGTFVYAAPEQHEDASKVDARADVYGLGMCVLFVLAGKHPPAFVLGLQPKFVDALECGEALRAVLRLAVAYEAGERTVTCEAIAAAVREELRRDASSGREWAQAEGGRWASFRVGGVEQRMRWIAPGTFMMGSPDDEDGHYYDEGPQHAVTLTQGY